MFGKIFSDILTRKPTEKKQKKKTGYISWWLFRTKGTAAEPWPTIEELRNDPDVQKEVRAVREAFKHIRNAQNN